jgi:sialic acid synthase SpsE
MKPPKTTKTSGTLNALLKQQPYLIAEIGSNWHTLVDVIESIKLASSCGASAAKFQYYTHKDLYGIDGKHAHEFPKEWLEPARFTARRYGIDLIFSVFSERGADEVAKYTAAFKIASAESNHHALLKHVCGLGKPVIVSTGACDLNDVSSIIGHLKLNAPTQSAILACAARYPAKDPMFENLVSLNQACAFSGIPVGYSDHTLGIQASLDAFFTYQAKIIEKHVNFVNALNTPDGPHSLSLNDFMCLAKQLKVRLAKFKDPSIAEDHDMLFTHKRRVVCIAPIKRGEKLKYNFNYGFHRLKTASISALYPRDQWQIDNKEACCDIQPGDPITLAHVK